jgi:hypothetical protein
MLDNETTLKPVHPGVPFQGFGLVDRSVFKRLFVPLMGFPLKVSGN